MNQQTKIPTGISAYKAADGTTKSSYGDLVSGEIKPVLTIEESWHKLREHMVEQRYTDQQIAIAAQSFDVGVETGKDNAAVNRDLVKALQYVLEDDGYLPRATSKCRDIARAALAKAGVK